MLAAGHRGGPLVWSITFGWLAARIAMAWTYQPGSVRITAGQRRQAVTQLRCAAIVPAYNEATDSIVATLRSLEAQTRPPDIVFIVDDGSTRREAVGPTLRAAVASPLDVRYHLQPHNRGKRFAQATAWAETLSGDVDVWLFIDSDTTLEHDAVEAMLGTFADDRVNAATSLILPRNGGPLALLQEIQYAACQLGNRVVESHVRALPVISGGFSAARDRVVRANLDRYLAGYWGTHIGDDRHMAILANLTGAVVSQPAARSYTEVPTTLGRLMKQRTRWARSFWLGQFWTLRYASLRRRVWWVAAYKLGYVAWSYGLIAWMLYVVPRADAHHLAVLTGYACVVAWLRAWRHLGVPHRDPWRALAAWLIAPLQLLFGLFALFPAQLYALVTCRQGAWGTR